MLLALSAVASCPDFYRGLLDRIAGWQVEWTPRELLTILMIFAALKFLGVRLILAWMPLRMALTPRATKARSEEHTSELQSLMRISYAVFCLKKKKQTSH